MEIKYEKKLKKGGNFTYFLPHRGALGVFLAAKRAIFEKSENAEKLPKMSKIVGKFFKAQDCATGFYS